MSVNANRPPVGGILTVSPLRGRALTEQFSAVPYGWFDLDMDNQALRYRFSHIGMSGVRVNIGSGSKGSSNTTLPIGNITLEVSVEEDHGASGTADSLVEVVFSSSQDVVSAVKNQTTAIVDRIAAGDSESAVVMIATCAEMLGSGMTGGVGATEARSNLLALAWNSTLVGVSAENVALRAAALELILAVPEEIDDATATSAIAFAGRVANSSRALGRISNDARTSLIHALKLDDRCSHL